ncbi:MAG: undecaprenyl/decaprenyl-phosphate alpha-N-acetylglucosaminyl 1-phosphate transferase [Acidobacteria bacterium]|uniref:Undecaprenyl/decaprenyl-phosphate alpha-N-acetylglucosaminyl 1-phosphate transferase n=1 Tax=Candidatus Polarisedimenticola svalbardensis TaxID=2886004 RepID=A0A8J6XUZ7_9BACT|nr:undecaprenyl/decaprenyl-phosphate alpha-N-acetylglucosaminyl 1-phosphate transferase [Candidatus Polarisedimenticola svalbardensis]
MSPWLTYLLAFILAAIFSLGLTPRMLNAALKFGIVDAPDGALKGHRRPVPYLGGLAIYLAFLLSLAGTVKFDGQVLGILLAGSILVVIGLVDDLGQIGPWTKLAGQLVAVVVLLKSGIFIQLVILPLWISLPVSILWLLAVTNAFNLIDIMDGLSAGTAIIAALALLVMAHLGGLITAAVILAALAGACAGFLKYNFQPARIYMGDSGALFIGLLLGALAMNNAYTERNTVAALAPAIILGVPLFDMLFVMYIRYRRGMSVMLGSPDHVALRLRKWRFSTRQTVVISYAVTALLGVAAIAMSLGSRDQALAVLCGLAVAALICAVLFKRIDMSL